MGSVLTEGALAQDQGSKSCTALLLRHYSRFLILNALLVTGMIREIPAGKSFIAASALLKKELLKIGYVEEMRTT